MFQQYQPASRMAGIAAGLLIPAGFAVAQNGDEASAEAGGIQFKLTGSAAYQFDTDIDSGGEFNVARYNFGIGAKTSLTDNWDLSLNLGYEFSDYDFSGNRGFVSPSPWEEIHTLSFGGTLDWQLNDDWTVFGGPIFKFSREDGADWGDGFEGGGFVGAAYEFSNDFKLGGGFGLISQIEDDVRFFPVFVIEWQIDPDWRLTNTSASDGSGVELIWDFNDTWEFALGGAYNYRRFRLDDDNIAAPDGVGEDLSFPIWLRATWTLNDNVALNFRGGIAFGGEVKLSDDNGGLVKDDDYDPGPFLGVGGTIRF